ncbi:MAG: hypothetical protein ACK5HT_07270, partial [Draconibacterium sp.]
MQDITLPILKNYLFIQVQYLQKTTAIKKILEVDYPRGRAKEYYANFISAKSLKIEFSLFHPSVS